MFKTDKRSAVPGFILERTAKRMKQYFQQQLQAVDANITADQWVILQELSREGGQSQHQLANATFKDAPTMTRIIDLLVKKELVERQADPQDRRRFKLELTAQGREKVASHMPMVIGFRQQAWKGLSDEDMDQLLRMLNQIFENMNEAEASD